MPSSLLTNYIRWMSESQRKESVITLSEFLNSETSYLSTAHETIYGSSNSSSTSHLSSYHSQIRCPICTENHDIATCPIFMDLSLDERYNKIRNTRLCFNCLKKFHIAKNSSGWNSSGCGKAFCTGRHHKLLHRSKNTSIDLLEKDNKDIKQDTKSFMNTFKDDLRTLL